jgi:hypothetical protein
MAIHQAFWVALTMTEEKDRLKISDCQGLLEEVKFGSKPGSLTKEYCDLLSNINKEAASLQDMGIVTDIHWIPA